MFAYVYIYNNIKSYKNNTIVHSIHSRCMYFILLYCIYCYILFYSIVCFYWRVFIYCGRGECNQCNCRVQASLASRSESNHPSMSFPVEQSRAECATLPLLLLLEFWATVRELQTLVSGPRHISSLAYWKLGGFERGKTFYFFAFFVLGENRLIFSTLLCSLSSLFWLWESLKTKKSFHVFNAGVRWRDN